jgi:signal transduction histidine kinase
MRIHWRRHTSIGRTRVNPAIDAAATQPYQGTDVAAFVFALTALLYLVLWQRDREPGMGWFALAWFGMAMVLRQVTAATGAAAASTQVLVPSPWYYLVALGLACMALGMVDYLGVPAALRRRALWVTLLPVAGYAALVTLAVAAGVPVLRMWMNLVGGACFVSLGGLAWWASRRERLAGHAYVAVALWGVPAVSLAMVIGKVHPVALRYFSLFPILVLALTLLTVSVLRRRRALEAEVVRRGAAEAELTTLNASLEQLVEQRTSDLRSMVDGLESFNRSVSHDLRGPLGGIAGVARLASDALQRGDDSLARRVLPLIADQAENSTRLVAALLSLAQVGDMALHVQAVDLRRLVAGVVDQLALERGDRKLPQIAFSTLPQVHADPELLQRVLANLIGNAIKFTRDDESGRIEIGAVSKPGVVEVFVRDNGVGFEADKAANLFVPFVRLHGTGFAGHGIGLSIVRRAVERHGGRVWAESQPGRGAVFRFSLPA